MVPLVRNKMGGRCDDMPGWIPDNQAGGAISGMTNYVCPRLSLRTPPALECLNRGIRSPPFIINSSTLNLKCWIPDHDVVMSGMTTRCGFRIIPHQAVISGMTSVSICLIKMT